MRLLFFIPGAQVITAELLKEHGLDLFFPASRESRHTTEGPDGVAGLLISSNDLPVERLVYVKGKQTWSPRFGFSSLVGHWLDDVPSIDDFVREKQTDGSQVKLLDGSHWLIPTLREWREDLSFAPTLPRVMQQCAKTGAFLLTAVVPEHRLLWETSLAIAEELIDQVKTNESGHIDYTRLFHFAIDVLKVNYVIDASVISHLGLLTPEIAGQIVRSALDWDSFRTALKKAASRLQPAVGTDTRSGATPQTTE